MGLDVFFLAPGTDDTVFYLRNHRRFQDMFFQHSAGEVREGFTDFYVNEDTITKVALDLFFELSRDMKPPFETPPQALQPLHQDGEDDHPWHVLLHYYLRVAQELFQAVRQHGYLICSWSA